MSKKYIYILRIIFIFFLLDTNIVFWSSNTWQFDNVVDYTASNVSSFNFTGSIATLVKNTFIHKWSIINTTTYNWAYDIVVEWNYAYMTNNLRNSVSILDISNPASPTLVTELVNNNWTLRLSWAAWIVKDWNYLYIASQVSDALQIINVTNPAAPTAAWQLVNATTLNWARWIAKVWNYVYLTCDTYDALQVINVTNPAAPAITWTYRVANWNLNWARDVKVVWNYAYVTSYNRDALSILDISNPASPTFITEVRDTTNLNWAWWLEIVWNYAYVSSYLNNSVRIIDITTPTAPVALSNISWWSYSLTSPRDLLSYDNKLFITSFWNSAVNVADITNRIAPVYVTKVLHNAANPLLNWAYWIYNVWDYFYVSGYNWDSLEVMKWSYNNTSPYLQPTISYNYWANQSLLTFWQTLWTLNTGTITYQISKNNWTTWYYWNGSAWTTTTWWVANSSSPIVINTNLATFNALAWWTWLFTFKAFLTSNWDQIVELDSVDITWTDPVSPGWVWSSLSLWLKANKWTSTTVSWNALTTWNDQSWNGNNATAWVSPIYLNNTTNWHLNFNPVVDFDWTTQFLQNLNNWANSNSYYLVIVPNSQVDWTLTWQVPFAFDCLSWILSSWTCGLSFAWVTLWAFTVAINDEVITHAIWSSTNWRSSQTGIASYDASKPMLIWINENATANGTDIYEKWVKVDNTTTNIYQTLSTADFSLWKTLDAANPFFYSGKIAEVINYGARTSDADRIKIESYLSLKYGITLNNWTQNYVASNGSTLIWSTAAAGSYTNNIFGIWRDNLSELWQVKSKSSNNDWIITLEAIWEWTNLVNSFVDIADKEFMSISNNNLWNTWTNIWAPSLYNIITRKWKVQEVGDVWTITMDFDVENTIFNLPVPSSGANYYFVYDSNTNGSLSDETPQVMTNMWWNIWRITLINLWNNQIFTLAALAWTNNIPTNISLSSTNINENISSNSTVWTLTTTDADIWDTHTYTFVTWAWDTDNYSFSIVWNSLKITESPDFELKNTYYIRINTNDGNWWNFQKSFTITINDLWEVINSLLDFELASNKYFVTSWNWSRVTSSKFEWAYSLQSNNWWAVNSQSCFQVNHTFSATWTIDFKYSVSSQAGADFLRFYIDDIEQQFWSWTVAWSTYNKTDITSWFHTYKWCYIKDWATNTWLDSAFVDYITYQNTNVDLISPVISSINFLSWSLLPWWNHNIFINYSDAGSWINTSSDLMTLNKWNWTIWWPDISATWLNLWTKIINSTSATYTTNNLAYWKYRYNFQISDNNWNSSSTWAVFYIDRPEIIVNTGSYISSVWPIFPTDEIIVTIKTVWAAYKLEFLENTTLNDWFWNVIIDWNWVTWVWYDKSPYSWPRKNIPLNPILWTWWVNININWNLNSYIYNIKVWSIVTDEQSAGDYEMDVSFRWIFNY